MAAASDFCPYVGLQPFTEEDRAYFFGREREIRLVSANLFAAKLTVLYGESGVGKSSLLMAGVVPGLRSKPRTAVVMFRDWQRPDALSLLKSAVARAADETVAAPLGLDAAAPLDELLAAAGKAIGGTTLVLLDQFEEYFLYFPPGGAGDVFDAELARAVNRREVNAGFVLSIREDSLSKLDRFRARIPTVLANPLRIRHLQPPDARDAIVKPLEVYNRRPGASTQPVKVEPALVDALIEQIVSGQVSLAASRDGAARRTGGDERIEAPYLQLVLTRLWEQEARAGSASLRLATLEKLGGAARIVRTHLDAVMSKLPAADKALCAKFFDRMVTPSGTKIACRLDDLKQWAPDARAAQVERVLTALAAPESRILRVIDSLPGEPRQYEIFHDVLAAGVLDWQARYASERRKRSLIGASAAIVLVVVAAAAALVWNADRERQQADVQRRKALAEAELEKVKVELERERAAAAQAAAEAAEARRRFAEREASTTSFASKGGSGGKELSAYTIKGQGGTLVYVQYADPTQREQVGELRGRLQQANYVVPAAEQVRSAPARNEVRYFRQDDADAARRLANIVDGWNMGGFELRLVKGYEDRVRTRQLEVWLARPDDSALRALVQRMNASTPEERKPAVAQLTKSYAASPAAIGEVLALFDRDSINALTAEGRINALYFLTRTAPSAWTAELERRGREVVALLQSRERAGLARMGNETRAELQRLETLLGSVRAGQAPQS